MYGLYEMPRNSNFVIQKTDQCDLGLLKEQRLTTNGYKGDSWNDENV